MKARNSNNREAATNPFFDLPMTLNDLKIEYVSTWL